MFLSSHSSPACKHPFSLMMRSTRFPTSSVYIVTHKHWQKKKIKNKKITKKNKKIKVLNTSIFHSKPNMPIRINALYDQIKNTCLGKPSCTNYRSTCSMVTVITVVKTPIKLSSTHSSAARMQPLSYMFLSPVWVGKFKLVHFSAYYKHHMIGKEFHVKRMPYTHVLFPSSKHTT